MTTNFLWTVLSLSLISGGCGSEKGSNFAGDTQNANTGGQQNQDPQMTLVVANTAAEPACNGTNESQLIYVKDVSQFKVCSGGSWSAIDIKGPKGDTGAQGVAGATGATGAAGADGIKILSNRLLPFYDYNICTQYSSIESCYYTGGQVVKLSDNSVIITSSYAYDMLTSDPEWDRMTSSLTLIVPPNVPGAWQRLDWSITRTGFVNGALHFVYQRQPEKFLVVFDDDADGPDPDDEIIKDLTPENW